MAINLKGAKMCPVTHIATFMARSYFLTLFRLRGDDGRLFRSLKSDIDRAFPDLGAGVERRAVAAARRTASLVVLKGRDSIVAPPDGMPPFDACCAAIWIHAEAALRFGPGLVAGDIPDMVSAIPLRLLAGRGSLHHMRQEDSRDEIPHPDMFDCADAGPTRSKSRKLLGQKL
jgi:hypothetical protein